MVYEIYLIKAGEKGRWNILCTHESAMVVEWGEKWVNEWLFPLQLTRIYHISKVENEFSWQFYGHAHS